MRWESEAEFHHDDPRRGGPATIEYGARWFTSAEADPWRICWLEATGELVAVQLGLDRPDGPVELLAQISTRAGVEQALRGWWQVCGHRGSLPWARRRAHDESGRSTTPTP